MPRHRRVFTAVIACGLLTVGIYAGDPTPGKIDNIVQATHSNTRLAAANLSPKFDVLPDGSLSGAVAAIPTDSGRTVKIGDNQNVLQVGLPNPEHNRNGIVDPRNGTVSFESNDGTSDTVIQKADGVQFLKTIENPSASTSFSYSVAVPQGGKLALVTGGPEGVNHTKLGALVMNAQGAVISTVDLPWAYDANGKPVDTHFSTDGNALTQHVDHTQPGVKYPIVADPYWHWYGLGVVVTFPYNEMQLIAAGGITAAQTLLGGSALTGVGLIPGAVVSSMLTTVAAGASWGVLAHQCFWFWLPYPGVWDTPGNGYYSC